MNTKTVLSTFPKFMENWKLYKKQFPNVKEWYIASDYCLDKYSKKPTQVITFTLCPSVNLKWLQTQITNFLKSDSKERKNFSDKEIKFIRDNKYFFSISVIIDKQGTIFVDELKKELELWLQRVKQNNNGKNNIEGLRKFDDLKRYLSKKSCNKDLVTKIKIVAIIVGMIIEFLIIKYNVQKVLWIPDRGQIIDFDNSIVIDLIEMCYLNLIHRRKNHNFLFGIAKENSITKRFDFDPMIRYPDIISGVISSINFKKGIATSEKHFDMFVNGIASNKRICIFTMENGNLKDVYRIDKTTEKDKIVRASSVITNQ